MSRVARLLGAVVAVVCCLVPVAVPAAQAAPAQAADRLRAGPSMAGTPVAPEREPLSIETLSPSYLQPGTPVQVSGTVFNNTDGVWGDAQVGMLVSGSPFTSSAQVAAATRADPYEDFAGEQVLAPGTFDDIGDVAPGQSRSFTFTVPYRQLDLTGGDGVYWVGAELRVTDGDGLRGSVARTLTFMPQVSDAVDAPKVDLAMMWPLLAPVPWNGEEYVRDSLPQEFLQTGRLRMLAELGASAGKHPLTWVVDPAVLDHASRMSHGFTVDGRNVPADSAPARDAASWLRLVRRALSRSVALAVPYGNPDVASIAHAGIRPGLRGTAHAGASVLDALGVARRELFWPLGGRADQNMLDRVPETEAEVTLLSRDTFEHPPAQAVVGLPRQSAAQEPGPTSSGSSATRPSLVVTSDRSRTGLRAQPGQSTLEWRQLILANTALRALFGTPQSHTAIAMPAPGWWPDVAWRDAHLFQGLRVPWVKPVSTSALVNAPHPTYRGGLEYPPALAHREFGPRIMGKVRRLGRISRKVDALLTHPESSKLRAGRAFGLSTSTAWRGKRDTGREIASAFVTANRDMLQSIRLEAPDFVTLSSTSGRFPIAITNGLDAPVTVDLSVTARDPNMTIAPIGPLTLQRDQRVTVTVPTNSRGVGITTLTARMLTKDGKPFGRVATFQVRTTQIGTLVWVIMGVGGAVLFIAAGRRIFSRVRRHRRRVRGGR